MAQETPPAEPQPPAPAAEESRRERLSRRSAHTARWSAVVVFVLVAIYLILLIVENTRHVKLSYVFGSGHAPVLWIVIVSALVGWILGIATSVILRRRGRRVP
jgi:uncharacterized integral membrane protein